MMACGLIKATLFVVLCITFVGQTSAALGRCINRNSAPNQCNCQLYSNSVQDSEGSTPVVGAVIPATITAEEFRPRVVGNRILRRRPSYLTECVALCLNHLRVKLQQPNVVADLTENEVPTSGFLTTAGKDGLCEWIYGDPVAAAAPGAATAPGDDPTQYYFLTVSRPCNNENTWSKTVYIGDVNCECYHFSSGFQRCFSSQNADIAMANGMIDFLP